VHETLLEESWKEEQSDCDSDEHRINSLGYHIQLDNGQTNENDFIHVYDN